jgi:TP901 family phage tail tape measure protein
MSSYITANMVFNAAKRQLSQMVEEVKAVDTAMVELSKVTSATEYEFQEFAKSATKTGIELGASVSDVINATSTFSRAGFNLPDAEELGKIATLYKNVGDGITIDSASESIISVMKAFNIEAENSIGIIDRINEVSNRAAIDSGGLGLALQRVASAMDAANNSLDETIALTTVSNEIVQNPEMVAQGWRTVALRIRGAKSELEDAGLETEGMVESTAKLRDLIKGISGVDIMLDENTFKSTYQIIDELGRVWDKISDIDQASLLEAIAGRFYLNVQKCA